MAYSPLLSRILGTLFGCASGDALGYRIEFRSWDSICELYGEDGILQYDMSRGKAVISDDTQMTLFTAAGMILAYQHHADPVSSIYRAYQDWYQTQDGEAQDGWDEENWLLKEQVLFQRQAPGNTCLNALGSHSMGSLTTVLNNSKGCGGVMRTSVCGFIDPALFSDFPAEHAAALLGAQTAAITHSHDMGWLPGGMLADMIYRIVYHHESIPDAAQASLSFMKQLFPKANGLDAFEELITRAIEWGNEDTLAGQPWDEENIQELGGGWFGDEALAIAIYCACKYPNDFSACIRAAVNHSGDSDSTGAIAGAIVGASLGIEQIDPAWIEPLDAREILQDTAVRLEKTVRTL